MNSSVTVLEAGMRVGLI